MAPEAFELLSWGQLTTGVASGFGSVDVSADGGAVYTVNDVDAVNTDMACIDHWPIAEGVESTRTTLHLGTPPFSSPLRSYHQDTGFVTVARWPTIPAGASNPVIGCYEVTASGATEVFNVTVPIFSAILSTMGGTSVETSGTVLVYRSDEDGLVYAVGLLGWYPNAASSFRGRFAVAMTKISPNGTYTTPRVVTDLSILGVNPNTIYTAAGTGIKGFIHLISGCVARNGQAFVSFYSSVTNNATPRFVSKGGWLNIGESSDSKVLPWNYDVNTIAPTVSITLTGNNPEAGRYGRGDLAYSPMSFRSTASGYADVNLLGALLDAPIEAAIGAPDGTNVNLSHRNWIETRLITPESRGEWTAVWTTTNYTSYWQYYIAYVEAQGIETGADTEAEADAYALSTFGVATWAETPYASLEDAIVQIFGPGPWELTAADGHEIHIQVGDSYKYMVTQYPEDVPAYISNGVSASTIETGTLRYAETGTATPHIALSTTEFVGTQNIPLPSSWIRPEGFDAIESGGGQFWYLVRAGTVVVESDPGEVVIGNRGNWRYDDNDIDPPGGTIEKGWPRGKRAGYADGHWVTDGMDYDDIYQEHVTTLDHEWAILTYVVAIGSEVEGWWSDSDWDGDLFFLRAALLRRVDNALYVIQKDVEIDVFYSGSDREGLYVQRLNDHDVAVGYYQAFQDTVDPFDIGTSPAITVLRRVQDEIDIVATKGLWSDFDAWWWQGGGYEQTVRSIAPLSDNKFVVETFFPDIEGIAFVNNAGVETIVEDDLFRGLIVCELSGTTINIGSPVIFNELWTNPGMCAVNESRIIVADSYESRYEYRDVLHIGTHVGGTERFRASLHIRSWDIDGLTITENGDTGAFPDPFSYMGYGEMTGVCMVNDRTGIVGYTRSADLQKRKGYRPYTLGGSYDPTAMPSADPALYEVLPPRTAIDDALNPLSAWGAEKAELMPAAIRFEVEDDGSISTEWVPHILEAGSGAVTNQDFVEGIVSQPNWSAFNTWVAGVNLEPTASGVVANWLLGGSTTGPLEWLSQADHVWKATYLVLDDESRSGIAPSGMRHLGQMGYRYEPVVHMDLKQFPGTNWFVCTGYYTWGDDPVVDSARLSPELFPGFPADAATWGDDGQEYGYYPLATSTWDDTGREYIYDYWEYELQKYSVPLDNYGMSPWDEIEIPYDPDVGWVPWPPIFPSPEEASYPEDWGGGLVYGGVALVDLYWIAPPLGEISAVPEPPKVRRPHQTGP